MGSGSRRVRQAGEAPAAPRRRRRWLVPVCVIAALVLGELFAAWVGPHIPRKSGAEERAFIKADQMYRLGRTDVLILGSSETAGGLLPETIDSKAPQLTGVYNGALAGTELPLYQEWAERVAMPALHPKVVVIGLVPMSVYRYGGNLSTADLRQVLHDQGIDLKHLPTNPNAEADASYQSAFDQIDPGGLGSIGWKLRRYSALIRYRPYLRQPSLLIGGLRGALGLGEQRDDTPHPNGIDWKTETDPRVVAKNTAPTGEVYDYQTRSTAVTTDPLGAAIYRVIARGRPDFTKLDALVKSIRSRGATPVVALAPIDRTVLKASGLDFGRFDALVAQIQQWGSRHRVPVNDAFTSDWSADDFHDRTHVDLAGARRWSDQVGTWLSGLCRDGTLTGACGAAR